MENHPIPQDITGFQFKLIGDMTLKQFAYVAGGVITAWFIYILPLYAIIRIPLSLLSLAFGASLAFLPVSGRPFDVMIEKFFIAVFSPTQYIYQAPNVTSLKEYANATNQSLRDISSSQFKNFINALPLGKKNKLDEKEQVFFQNVSAYSSQSTTNPTPQPTPVAPHIFADKNPAPEKKKEDLIKNVINSTNTDALQKEAMILQKELSEAKEKETKEKEVNSKDFLAAHQKVLELQKTLGESLSQKQELERQVQELEKKMQVANQKVYSPTVASQPNQQTKFVRSVPQAMAKNVGLPTMPEFPNVITGIIKDPRGNPLANILVEVKDLEGNAVRAFKTNALGQFASATPLTNGKYTISFEDPKEENKFDTVSFEANGQVILPIEAISIDSREELRRSLFSN